MSTSTSTMESAISIICTHNNTTFFPLKLMDILDNKDISDVITWLPHGRGFTITDKRRFAEEVMPIYFRESKYTSFTRRLNRWKFTIQTQGHKKAAYYHPFFIKGDVQSCEMMRPLPQPKRKKKHMIKSASPTARRPNTALQYTISMDSPEDISPVGNEKGSLQQSSGFLGVHETSTLRTGLMHSGMTSHSNIMSMASMPQVMLANEGGVAPATLYTLPQQQHTGGGAAGVLLPPQSAASAPPGQQHAFKSYPTHMANIFVQHQVNIANSQAVLLRLSKERLLMMRRQEHESSLIIAPSSCD
uniref:HSF-type DNA-binding domain-containing protein n=1 Tax=Chaetoceros debilis TaxID=122233 RepID=A0A7S3VEM9_9STRA